ncbi:MAG: alpha/beta hydrolase [Myxococcales bacterium]|nr:alpha/beta hydrolase [Myxococcales bacterium]
MWRRALASLAVVGISTACRAPTEIDDVPYDSRYGDDTKLDLYLPDESGPQPAILLIHGGAWRWGDKRHFANAARRFARSGYVAASINYRLVPSGVYPNAPKDCGCALAFLQANADEYGIDPKRIAIMGYSAGGHLTSLLGVAWDEDSIAPDCEWGRPARPAAVIPGAGAHDLRARADAEWVQDFMGGTLDELPDKYEQASPIAQIQPGEPPFLLIDGGGDWIGAPEQARPMRDALRAVGTEADELRLAGGGHLLQPGVDPGELAFEVLTETPEAWLVIADFLARHIGEP